MLSPLLPLVIVQVDEKKAADLTLTSEFWDIIHVKVYRADDLPKVDKSGWCDAYCELKYDGLLDKRLVLCRIAFRAEPCAHVALLCPCHVLSKPMKTKDIAKTNSPLWNHEFEIPIPSATNVMYNRMELLGESVSRACLALHRHS